MPGPLSSPQGEGDLECWLRPGLPLFLSTLPPWFPWAMFCPARFPWGHLDSIAILNALLYVPTPPRDLLLRIPTPVMEMTASDQLRQAQEETAPHARCPLLAVPWYPPQFRWAGRSSSPQGSCTSPGASQPAACGVGSPAGPVRNNVISWYLGLMLSWGLHRLLPDPLLTCRSSSSFTRDQVLMKLSLRSVRMGGLSRTVSRRVRPEPVQGKAKGEQP